MRAAHSPLLLDLFLLLFQAELIFRKLNRMEGHGYSSENGTCNYDHPNFKHSTRCGTVFLRGICPSKTVGVVDVIVGSRSTSNVIWSEH